MSVIITADIPQTQRDLLLDVLAGAQAVAHLIQMAIYWGKYDDAIDRRDAKITKQIEFMQDVQNYKTGADLDMLRCKKDVLASLGVPGVDMCSDAVRCADESEGDGRAVDLKSSHLADQTCEGMPSGWYAHEGTIAAAKGGSHAGGLISNNARRMEEQFRGAKTTLVTQAQHNMKSVFRSSEVLAMYSQGAAIHQGFADIYISGFNSAGAAAGVALGRLAGGTSSGGGPTFGGSISGTPMSPSVGTGAGSGTGSFNSGAGSSVGP